MAEFASKFNIGCVIQYYSDQWVAHAGTFGLASYWWFRSIHEVVMGAKPKEGAPIRKRSDLTSRSVKSIFYNFPQCVHSSHAWQSYERLFFVFLNDINFIIRTH